MSDKHEANLVVSVESRKGGVGKTTAALFMAKELISRKYNVLFLDLDITGTNAADISESTFWKKDIHVLQRLENGKNENINLIKLFTHEFMMGNGVPEFAVDPNGKIKKKVIGINSGKINIIGSQIYGDGKNHLAVESPGILFDNIHAIFLLDFIKEIIGHFVSAMKSDSKSKKKRNAVVLDTSPGFVGITPEILEWLTDLGPKKGKFLMVTSPDRQDLKSCGFAVDHVHNRLKKKWGTYQLFHKMKSQDSEKLDFDDDFDKKFFMRLATMSIDHTKQNNPLKFYNNPDNIYIHNDQDGCPSYLDYPDHYMAAVINRASPNYYEYLEPHENPSSILQDLLTYKSSNPKSFKMRRIFNNKYLGYQFETPLQDKGKTDVDGDEDSYDNFTKLIDESDASIAQITCADDDCKNIKKTLTKTNNLFNNVLNHKYFQKFDDIKSYIQKNHVLPEKIISEYTLILNKYMSEIVSAQNPDGDEDFLEITSIEQLKTELIRDVRAIKVININDDDLKSLSHQLSKLVSLVLSDSEMKNIKKNSLLKHLKLVLFFESIEWNREEYSERYQLFFTAIKNMHHSKPFLMKKNHEDIIKKHMDISDFKKFIAFYKDTGAAQARLMDIGSDSRFFLQLIKTIVINETQNPIPLFRYITHFADEVIVNKRCPHDKANEKLIEAMEEAGYYEQFKKITSNILISWGAF
ncbi:MAG: P-loop NTPase [Desulfobacteraceae bacterium]|jgi:hypothetical protein